MIASAFRSYKKIFQKRGTIGCIAISSEEERHVGFLVVAGPAEGRKI
jgi:hypothetical protein